MIRCAIAVFVLIAGAAQAQNAVLPTYYNVQGVASDDALNIRAQPDAGAPVLGVNPRL
ncbi:hypothetical protein NBRC116596_15030 [Litorivita sp. NS0012-18]